MAADVASSGEALGPAGPGPASLSQAACGTSDAARRAYVMEMRRIFSPAGMLHADGSIDQGFFKPKRVVLINDRKWGDAERDALYRGLEHHGVGKWREIGAELLPGWDEQQIRIRASRLLGTQSLVRYVGWKGGRQAVDAEYARNKAIGEATGCWKNGTLVEDDSGSVRKYFEGLSGAAAPAAGPAAL